MELLDGIFVLVVDDEPSVCEMLTEQLGLYGAHAIGLTDFDADSATLVNGPDLIVLDIMLRGHSGVDIAKALRARRYQGPMIAMSASDEMLQIPGEEVLFAATIPKPYEMVRFLSTVMDVLGIEVKHPQSLHE